MMSSPSLRSSWWVCLFCLFSCFYQLARGYIAPTFRVVNRHQTPLPHAVKHTTPLSNRHFPLTFGPQRLLASTSSWEDEGGDWDAHEVLGISKKASFDEIKEAYRKLVDTNHPEKFTTDEEKFQAAKTLNRLNLAFRRLRDQQTQESTTNQVSKMVGEPFPTTIPKSFSKKTKDENTFPEENFGSIADLMSSLFGEGPSNLFEKALTSQFSNFGSDAHTTITLPFKTSILGGTHKLTASIAEPCDNCSATGYQRNPPNECTACGGSGMISKTQRTPFGIMNTRRTCSTCHGSGINPQDTCSKCQGSGVKLQKKELEVNIPAGVSDGVKLRIPGIGHTIPGQSERGDLYVDVKVNSHPEFERDGNDLISEVHVNYAAAILGTTLDAQSIDGPVRLVVPPGTQPGTRLRLRGRGVLLNSGERGDALFTVRIHLPTELSNEERELLARLAAIEAKKPPPQFDIPIEGIPFPPI